MTKSSKHKQAVRKEKNKIKLKLAAQASKTKGGKKLPKGLNVTDTSFKTRKIVIPTHLRDEDTPGQPSTSKKHNLKEVLSHLQHFSTSIRQDGLKGLKELMLIDPTVIPNHLSTILERLGELAVGKEASLRTAAIKELHFVLKQVSESDIVPFFPLIMAYLSMGLSHIHAAIQQNALSLLDVLTETVPNLLAKAAGESRLLPNFLEQISRKSEAGKGKDGSRILIVNPSQKMTSLKWRYQVLTRIWKVLTLLPLDKQSQRTVATVSVNEAGATYAPVYCAQDEASLHVSEDGLLGNEKMVIEFIDLLNPVLLETWVEASVDQIRENGSLLIVETADILNCVLELYLLTYKLHNYINRASVSLQEEYSTDFIRRFLKGFPYAQYKGSLNTANLNICLLWSIRPQGNEHAIVNFLSKVCTSLNAEEATKFNEVLSTLCRLEHSLCAQRVVPSVIEYITTNFPKKDSLILLDGLVLTMTQASFQYEKIPLLGKFRDEIPLLLKNCRGRKIPSTLLHGLCQIAQQGSPKFVDNLRLFLTSFLDQATEITVAGERDDDFQQKLMFLSFWATRHESYQIQKELLNKLSKFGLELVRLESLKLLLDYCKEN